MWFQISVLEHSNFDKLKVLLFQLHQGLKKGNERWNISKYRDTNTVETDCWRNSQHLIKIFFASGADTLFAFVNTEHMCASWVTPSYWGQN